MQPELIRGVLTDFLDLLPPHSSRMLWTFPTYSKPDVAFFIFLFTVSTRERATRTGKIAADATSGPDGYILIFLTNDSRGTMNWVGNSLEGYYAAVRRAILVSLLLRTALAGWFIRWIYKRLRRT